MTQFPPRSAIRLPSAMTSNWPVLPGVTTGAMSRRFLMRATRLVTLALLFCHVGQYTISIFILFSDLSSIAA